MIGTLVSIAIVTTPVIGLIWIIFTIWETFEGSRER